MVVLDAQIVYDQASRRLARLILSLVSDWALVQILW
jgi:hypothetical protein